MADAVRDELRDAYLKAEDDFRHAFRQMNHWKSETDRTNALAAEALRKLEEHVDG